MLRRQVHELVRIGREVVELPHVVVEARAALMADRHPPIAVEERALTAELEVLRRTRRRVGVREGREDAGALDGLETPAAVDRRTLDTGRFEDGRVEVDDVHETLADLATRGNAARPRDDQRIGDAAEVRVLLVEPIRRVGAQAQPIG